MLLISQGCPDHVHQFRARLKYSQAEHKPMFLTQHLLLPQVPYTYHHCGLSPFLHAFHALPKAHPTLSSLASM